MKKISFTFIIFSAVFSLIIGVGLAQAKTQEFTFPVIEEPSNLFEEIIFDLGLNNFFNFRAQAVQMIKDNPSDSRIGADGEDAEYSNGMIYVDDKALSGANDGHFYIDFPTVTVYSSSGGLFDFSSRNCPPYKGDTKGDCYIPSTEKELIHPWRVFKTQIYTSSVTTNNCQMNTFITEPGFGCKWAGDNGRFYGASDGLCQPNGNIVTAYLDEGNFWDRPAGRACGHVRISGGTIGSSKKWWGYLKATAKSPEFDDFKLKGKNPDTGNVDTAGPGQTLEICSGETAEVKWEATDVQNVWLVFGNVDTASCGGCAPGQPTSVGLSGSKTVKPLESTSFSLVVRGATGDGVKYLSPDPIYLSLRDCAPPPPSHCEDENEGQDPFCTERYPIGSKKRCCIWPEQGEFGDGCGKCGGNEDDDVFVDLKINGSNQPAQIDSGGSVNLFWESENAVMCEASEGWSGDNKPVGGQETIYNITQPKNFTITCYNQDKSASASDSVSVIIKGQDSPVSVKLSINGSDQETVQIPYNGTANLSWQTSGATSCVALGDWGGDKQVPGGSSIEKNLKSDKVFTLDCFGPGGSGSDTVYADVGAGDNPNQPSLKIKANGQEGSVTIPYKGTADLSWKSFKVSNCIASGSWSGSRVLNVDSWVVGNITQDKNYILTCDKDGGGKISDNVEVKVASVPKGNINVRVRLNGEVVAGQDVSYAISGPQSFSGSGPKTFNNAKTGQYVITYQEGLPEIVSALASIALAEGENSIQFLGYSPARTLLVKNNQTTTFYLDFGTIATCNLSVVGEFSACDGSNPSSWSGPVSYALIGDAINLNGTGLPQFFSDIPAGNYYLTDMMNGPGLFDGVEPSNPVFCSPGETSFATMKFKDCGAGGFRYSCNLQSGRCEICVGSVEQCPHALLSACQNDCGGGDCQVQADISCWTNYDGENCVGLIDGDGSPNIVLSNTAAGCPNVSSCEWEIIGDPQYNQNSCAPFSWYDEAGTYTAKITVTDNSGGVFTDTQQFTVRDINGIECDFAWSVDNIKVNQKVDFFDRSLTQKGAEVVSWIWTFQGASPATSTSQIVQDVMFGSVGQKTVTLQAKNSNGQTCELSKKINVQKVNPSWQEVIPD